MTLSIILSSCQHDVESHHQLQSSSPTRPHLDSTPTLDSAMNSPPSTPSSNSLNHLECPILRSSLPCCSGSASAIYRCVVRPRATRRVGLIWNPGATSVDHHVMAVLRPLVVLRRFGGNPRTAADEIGRTARTLDSPYHRCVVGLGSS